MVAGTGKELRELRAEAITEYPQILQNVRVGRGASLDDAGALWEEVRAVETELGEEGRVLVRASGTEPLIRVMVEAPSEEAARRYADRLIERHPDLDGEGGIATDSKICVRATQQRPASLQSEVTRRKVIEIFGGCLPGQLRSSGWEQNPEAIPEQRPTRERRLIGPPHASPAFKMQTSHYVTSCIQNKQQ